MLNSYFHAQIQTREAKLFWEHVPHIVNGWSKSLKQRIWTFTILVFMFHKNNQEYTSANCCIQTDQTYSIINNSDQQQHTVLTITTILISWSRERHTRITQLTFVLPPVPPIRHIGNQWHATHTRLRRSVAGCYYSIANRLDILSHKWHWCIFMCKCMFFDISAAMSCITCFNTRIWQGF